MSVGFVPCQSPSSSYRTSRSESPEMTSKSPPLRPSHSDARLPTQTPMQHQRSRSDPAMMSLHRNGALTNASSGDVSKCDSMSVTSTSSSSRQSPQGLPVNVNPRNLVMKFDARKDNLSFSAIHESEENQAGIDSVQDCSRYVISLPQELVNLA